MSRQESRYNSDRMIFILDQSVNRYEATLRDLSKTGARLMSEAPLKQKGDAVLLDFGDGDIKQAAVCWVSGREMGIRFDDVR